LRSFHPPPEWSSYSGHYRANHAWFNNFRIVVRRNKLLLVAPGGQELVLAPDGRGGGFRAGEEGKAPRDQISFRTPVHARHRPAFFPD
jgi:D-alanyl-D-alanine carboxypeptidase